MKAKPCVVEQAMRFTLIELLVVVAIVAVLISMLMPALSNARSLARGVVCKSNLCQLGLMLSGYEGDFGCLPAANDGHSAWTLHLYQTGYIAPDPGKSANWWSSVTPSNCRKVKCDMNQNPNYVGGGLDSSVIGKDNHYGFNIMLAHQLGVDPGASCSGYMSACIVRGRISKPSSRMLLGENCSFGYVIEGSATDYAPLAGSWYPHNVRMNIIFLDSHAETRGFSQMTGWSGVLFGGGSD